MSAPAKKLLMVCEANPSQAGLGRFVSRDQVKQPNRYAYANNAPQNYVDPQGLQATGPALGAAGLAGCILAAYWEGKNHEAKHDLPVSDYNEAGQWVYDKYVHCVTACEINRCFMAAGAVSGAVLGGAASLEAPFAFPFAVTAGGATGAGLYWIAGGVVISAGGGLFETVQWASHALDPNKLYPLGHGTMQDEAVNMLGAALAMQPGSCISNCSKQKMCGD